MGSALPIELALCDGNPKHFRAILKPLFGLSWPIDMWPVDMLAADHVVKRKFTTAGGGPGSSCGPPESGEGQAGAADGACPHPTAALCLPLLLRAHPEDGLAQLRARPPEPCRFSQHAHQQNVSGNRICPVSTFV